jgi:hypothetical protein
MNKTPSNTATYLYAIVAAEEAPSLPVAGVDGEWTVHAIVRNGLAAVVGTSALEDYRGLQRPQAAAYLVAHQRVVEQIIADYRALPVKFGTVLPNESYVVELLDQERDLFIRTIERFAGRIQMEAVVLWDLHQVFAEIGQEADIVEIKARIADRPAEETTDERVLAGMLAQASLEMRRDALTTGILPRMRALAEDIVVNPIMDDSMILNAALLMRADVEPRLDALLDTLDHEYAGALTFRCVGPLPPYSFATVEVQVPQFEALDASRLALGLPLQINLKAVRTAYRELAQAVHPDLNPSLAGAEEAMAALTRHYQLLNEFLVARAADGGDVVLTRAAVGETLFVRVARQDADDA